jgi:hypothetical protein
MVSYKKNQEILHITTIHHEGNTILIETLRASILKNQPQKVKFRPHILREMNIE